MMSEITRLTSWFLMISLALWWGAVHTTSQTVGRRSVFRNVGGSTARTTILNMNVFNTTASPTSRVRTGTTLVGNSYNDNKNLLRRQLPVTASSSTPSTTPPLPNSNNSGRNYQLICRTMETHKVTLLRISPKLLQAQSATPMVFYVDATIPKIIIEVNGTDAMGTTIMDPSGRILNNRFKRHAQTQPEGKFQTPDSKIHHVHDDKFNLRRRVRRQAPLEHKQSHRLRTNLSFNIQNVRNTFNITKTPSSFILHFGHSSPAKLQPNSLSTRNGSLSRTKHNQDKSFNSSALWRRKSLDSRGHQSSVIHKVQQQHYDKHHKPQLYTVKQVHKQRNLQEANHIRRIDVPKSDFSKIFLGHKWFRYSRLKSNILSQNISPRRLRDSNKSRTNETRFGKHAQWIHTLQQHRHYSEVQRMQPDMAQSVALARLPQEQRYGQFSHPQEKVGHLVFSRKEDQVQKQPPLQQLESKDVRVVEEVKKHRQKRTATMMSFEMIGDVAVWEMEPPVTGRWTVTVGNSVPTLMRVTGNSVIDFRFEFLDIRSMTDIHSQPVAYDTTLVRVYLDGLQCMKRAVRLELQNDTGSTFQTVAIDDSELTHGPDSTGVKNSVLVWFMMPGIPFYLTLTGYDVTGQKFQRFSKKRVVPRMFVISMVDYRGDPLVPGEDNRFGVRLRNKGRNDTFRVTASFDSDKYITAHTVPTVIQVEKDKIAHITVLVDVQPSVFFIMEIALTVTATCLSDNTAENLTEMVKAMPRRFLTDYEAPTCITKSQSAGCIRQSPCQTQFWHVIVDIVDRLTGVRSAAFQNPPRGSFTSVHFHYAMSNRSARAEYKSTCCSMETSLIVEDYASNHHTCRLIAPIVNTPVVTQQNFNSVRTIAAAINTWATPTTLPHRRDSTIPRTSAASSSPTRKSTTVSQTTRSNRMTLAPSRAPSITGPGRTSLSKQQSSKATMKKVTRHPGPTSEAYVFGPPVSAHSNMSSMNHSVIQPINRNLQKRPTWDDDQFTSLRLAAIVCGSIAGAAGVAIIVICVVYAFVRKRVRNRPGRQGSQESDVTMGSSWETRSEGSSGTDSLRLHRVAEHGENWHNEQEHSPTQHGRESQGLQGHRSGHTQHLLHPGRTGDRNEGGDEWKTDTSNEQAPGVRSPKTVMSGMVNRQSINHERYINFIRRRRDEEVEDVTFRCVVVPDTEQDIAGGAKASAVGTSSINRNGNASTQSYRPLLNMGGKVYVNMLEVQKRMEELDRRIREQTRSSCSRPDVIETSENRSELNSVRMNWQAGKDRDYEDTPPGSPRVDSGYSGSETQGSTSSASLTASLDGCHNAYSSEHTYCMHASNECLACGEVADSYSVVNAHNNNRILRGEQTRRQRETPQRHQSTSALNTQPQHQNIENIDHSSPSYQAGTSEMSQQYGKSETSSADAAHYTCDNIPSGARLEHAQALNEESRVSGNLHTARTTTSQVGDDTETLLDRRVTRTLRPPQHSPPRERSPHHHTPPELRRQVLEHNAHRRSSSPHTGTVASAGNRSGQNIAPPQRSSFRISPGYLNRRHPARASRHLDTNEESEVSEDIPGTSDNEHGASNSSFPAQPLASSTRQRTQSVDLPQVEQASAPLAGQMVLRQDIEHIRQKLLQFQRRIDDEIEYEERISRSHSPSSSGNHSNTEEDEDKV